MKKKYLYNFLLIFESVFIIFLPFVFLYFGFSLDRQIKTFPAFSILSFIFGLGIVFYKFYYLFFIFSKKVEKDKK